MTKIYDVVETPFKHGVVIRGGPDELVDCPNVFRMNGRWWMMYVCHRRKIGYETSIAASDDLLEWESLGNILPFAGSGWDAWQAAGGIALYETDWRGGHSLQQHDGNYWLSYVGGAKQGYEPDPLAIGIAHTDAATSPAPWSRVKQNPVLSIEQADVRDFERMTLYKSTIIRDASRSLNAEFVMYYNGKISEGYEKIGMALSDDMVRWRRYGAGPVIANETNGVGISGDPQIARIGDVWVMFYFGAFWKPGAFDTFACSYDLVNWTQWAGPDLVAPSESWDREYAHKPWVLQHDGVVYHFYCAVGDEGRTIALATSKPLR
jgi:predicted GH43/DUF377 family glycosyl hydrolase